MTVDSPRTWPVRAEWRADAEPRCFDGHFPGHIVLPGAYVLDGVIERFRKILQGAALMTETTFDVTAEKALHNKIPVLKLNDVLMENARLVDAPTIRPPREKTGSTDFGNVMRHVPGTCIRVAFVPEGAAAHSQEYLDAGKTEAAHNAVVYGAKILALTGAQLIEDPEKLEAIKKEFHENLAKELNGQS